MNILFGNKEIDAIRSEARFTILELDTIQPAPDLDTQTAYCLLSDIPMQEINDLERKVKMHHDMMHFYRTQQWDQCRELLCGLQGSWHGEVDSFYDEITKRLDDIEHQVTDTSDWDGVYRPWRN